MSQTYTLRRIFRSSVTSQNVIRELLQIMFLTELVDPGDDTWIVSPWISNVALLDNRAGAFDIVNPDWGRREIRLVDLALRLLISGCRLIIATRPDEHNLTFLQQLQDAAREMAVEQLLTVVKRDQLHTKGILTTRGLMLGSMNLTYNGVELNDEVVEYDTDNVSRANARLAFSDYQTNNES
jgi:hypothetical protein